jgi:hypothetical protein
MIGKARIKIVTLERHYVFDIKQLLSKKYVAIRFDYNEHARHLHKQACILISRANNICISTIPRLFCLWL